MTMTDSLSDLNDAIATIGGNWVTLYAVEHPPVEGVIVAFEKRDRTDPDGNVVYKKGTTTPRKVWTFTIKVDELDADDANDEGLRKIDLNESAQRAVATAVKASGHHAVVGGRLKIGVKADAPDKFKQAEYQAKYTPPAATLAIDEDEF